MKNYYRRMRISRPGGVGARNPYPESYSLSQCQYKQVLPAKLRDFVAQRKASSNEFECLPHMTTLFACLKRNEFSESNCQEELQLFKNCYSQFQRKQSARAALNKHSINSIVQSEEIVKLKPIRGQYLAPIVNQFLQRFKQPKHTDG
ncbi:hypothetical protein GJ496_003936 [Pomphorhynchus laevis]|nr:hypothetical protein GJ496_003936 [Pomphorhynchus laevis]